MSGELGNIPRSRSVADITTLAIPGLTNSTHVLLGCLSKAAFKTWPSSTTRSRRGGTVSGRA